MNETPPVTLLLLRAATRALDVEWADGTGASLPYRTLRESCPCAACRQRRRVAGALELTAQIDVTALVPCGPNAIQLTFSDGHARGIFPFSYLRELHAAAITRSPGTGISK